MRIIAVSTLKEYFEIYPACVEAVKSWIQEVESSDWNSPHDLKAHFASASILTGKRVVFNINGNNFRLIVDVEFRLKIVFVVWFGPHKEYDKIDSKRIEYVKTHKK